MRFLLVEDDSDQARLITTQVKGEFPDVKIDVVSTESDFLRSFEAIAAEPPDLVIMDVMLRWCNISQNMSPPPPECGDYSRAGVRCCWLLRNDERTQKIPIVVLTVLDNIGNGLGLPEGCLHLPKQSEFANLVATWFRQLRR